MILRGPEATEALGARLAAVARAGDVVLLAGGLGAGKTALARGVLRGLGLAGEAPSPTFTLVEQYAPPLTRLPVWHADLYRLAGPDEAAALALDEAEDGLLMVEWPERLGGRYDGVALALTLAGAGGPERRLTARVPPPWEGRWPPP